MPLSKQTTQMKTIYKSILFSFFLLNYFSSSGQAPNFQWAKSAGGAAGFDDLANSIAVDVSGNTYITGSFNSTIINFGSTALTNMNTNNSADIFLAKYDASGNVIWVRSAGGTGDDVAYSLVVDASGSVYITGYFDSSTITFGSSTLINASQRNIFLAKYDAFGNVIWAKNDGGTGEPVAYSIAADSSGNTFITGGFGGSSSTVSFGSIILTNAGNSVYDIFLAKYDPSGNILWAKSAGGTGHDVGRSVAVDASGNSYITGSFYSTTINFGSTILANVNTNSTEDIFLAKYDTSGNVIWAKNAGGTVSDIGYSIAVDTSGNTYIAGSFNSTTIGFGSTTLISAGYDDIFLAKYDALGNVIWAKSVGGTSFDYATSISVDASENTYVTGSFWSSPLTFGSTILTNAGGGDIFIAKYAASGNVIWAKSAGGIGDDDGRSVAIDASGNTFITGYFMSPSIAFGLATLTTAGGGGDIFIAKLGNTTGINELSNLISIYVFPNPSNGNFQLTIANAQFTKGELEIYNVIGEKVFQSEIFESKSEINLNLPAGLYFYKIKNTAEIIGTGKIIIQD